MKRLPYSLLFVAVFVNLPSANAQFSAGFVGVFNLPNLTVENEAVTGTSGLTAFGFGLVAQYNFGQNLAVVAEPMYLGKGAEIRMSDVLGGDGGDVFGSGLIDASIEFKYSYIEVPLLVKYYFTNDSARPYITAGPSVGFLSKAEVVGKVFGEEASISIKDETENMDVSALLGFGVEVPMGAANFFLDGRYALGLSNISAVEDLSIKTRGLQIAIGALFPIGGK